MTTDFYAAGVLVSAKQVLSNCHLFTQEDPYWQAGGALLVVAGTNKLFMNHSTNSLTAQKRHVERVMRHPKCFSTIPHIFGFDAALLILQQPMVLNKQVQPITLRSFDLAALEKELIDMVKKKVICNRYRWGWMAKEKPLFRIKASNLTNIPDDESYGDDVRRRRAATGNKTLNGVGGGSSKNATVVPGGAAGTTARQQDQDEEEADDYFDVPDIEGVVTSLQSYIEIRVDKVQITTNEECTSLFCKVGQDACKHDFGLNGQFCTMPWDMSNTTCLDSGGPLVCNGYLFGVLDFEMCLLQRTPTVYAGPKTLLDLLKTTPTTLQPTHKNSADVASVSLLITLILSCSNLSIYLSYMIYDPPK
ncbi:hypothetical protein GE061_017442 [Apolygus lucorum]|uniref:Uncharacterized protein n=1 Tax=Apolygus lucorum TaxID=248454 RepID=A0A6A4J4G5_APOLU|nr:hypothetical protein GE061_017442 [Apolygus lucorum]